MSAQCWCYNCAGKVVCRNTFKAHGRKNKPDSPIRAGQDDPLLVPDDAAPADYDEQYGVPDFSDSDDDEPLVYEDPFAGEQDDAPPIGRARMSKLEALLTFLDWMCVNKVTDKTAQDMWARQKLYLPEDVNLPSFPWIKRLLERSQHQLVQRIELCPNDCVAYWDSKYLPVPLRHAHRTKCPVCNEPRWLIDPRDGRQRAAKVFFHFPVAAYIKSMYSRADLVPYLYQGSGDHPEDHVTRSRGYKAKVTDNPHMRSDKRNLALIGTTDGVPFFDDQKRGAWPFLLKTANLPDGLCNDVANCHLTLLSANEYWEHDAASNTLRRRVRGPKTLVPHMSVIVDDLLRAYHRGCALF